MNETYIFANKYTKKKWYIIDCKNKQLGRIATYVTNILTGKLNIYYHPSFDTGHYVILINVKYLNLEKKSLKFHVFKPGRPGKSLKPLSKFIPERIVKNTVFGMLANGKSKNQQMRRLKVYQEEKHPHIAQNPIELIAL